MSDQIIVPMRIVRQTGTLVVLTPGSWKSKTDSDALPSHLKPSVVQVTVTSAQDGEFWKGTGAYCDTFELIIRRRS